MKNPLRQKIITVSALVVAFAFLIVGSLRTHQVQLPDASQPSPTPAPTPAFVPPPFPGAPGFPAAPAPPAPAPKASSQTISDRTLVINTTFGGVTRRADGLAFTADPSTTQGKQACPT